MLKDRIIAEKNISFKARIQVPELRGSDSKEVVCSCGCKKFPDGAAICEARFIVPVNSMCFFSGKADSVIMEKIV